MRGRPGPAVALAITLAWWAVVPTRAGAAPAPASAPAPGPQAAEAGTVATSAPLDMSEPAVAGSPQGVVVAATHGLNSAPTAVVPWTRATGASAWAQGPPLLSPGFTASYDPSAAALPDGSLAVVAVATTGGVGACLPGGSVELARSGPSSPTLGPATLVDDNRGRGGFDDRPFVAAGRSGTIWVGWSHGTDDDECQVVGQSDQVQLSTSHDGGHSFSAPVTLPKLTSGPAFGVEIAPLGAGRAAVSWAELGANGTVTVALSLVKDDGTFSPPRTVAVGPSLPLVLPEASFYSFSLVSLATFDPGPGSGSGLALAWPVWHDGAGAIVVAVSFDLGRTWSTTTVQPASGADLLLPALADDGQGQLRLLFADHSRSDDVLGFQTLQAATSPAKGTITLGTPVTVVAGSPGPGYKELGEFLFLTKAEAQVLGAVVAGGTGGTSLDLLRWPVAAPAPATHALAPRAPGARTTTEERPVSGHSVWWGPLWALPAVAAAVLVAALARRRRRVARRRARRRAAQAALLGRLDAPRAAHGRTHAPHMEDRT